MDTKAKVRELVLGVIEGVIDVPPDEVTNDKPFRDLGVDSLTALDVLTALEREFRVKLGEESMRRFVHIDGVAEVVAEALAHASQPVAAAAP
jgi:acyl carrier protein